MYIDINTQNQILNSTELFFFRVHAEGIYTDSYYYILRFLGEHFGCKKQVVLLY